MKAAVRLISLVVIATSAWLGYRGMVLGAHRIERRAPAMIAEFLGAESGEAASCRWTWSNTPRLQCRGMNVRWSGDLTALISEVRIVFHPWDAFTGDAGWSAQLGEISSAVATPEKLLGNLVLLWPKAVHGRVEWNGLAGVPGKYSLEMGPGKEPDLLDFKVRGEGAWSQLSEKLLVVGAWQAKGSLRRGEQDLAISVAVDGLDSDVRWADGFLHKKVGIPLRLMLELRGSPQEVAVDHLSVESDDLTLRGAGIVRREGEVVQMHVEGSSLSIISLARWFPSLSQSPEWSWLGGVVDLQAQLDGSAQMLNFKVHGAGRDLALQGTQQKMTGAVEGTWEKGAWSERKIDLLWAEQSQISLSDKTDCGSVREWCIVSSGGPFSTGRLGLSADGPYLVWDHDELRIRPAGPRR